VFLSSEAAAESLTLFGTSVLSWLAHMISPFRKRFIRAIRKSFKPQSYAKMTRGFVGAIGFSVPCASSVREGFTGNGSSEKLQAAIISQDDARLCRGNRLFSSVREGGTRLHDVFRRGSIGRYADRSAQAGLSGFEVSHQEQAK
jgi:hypothetical protein